MDFCTYECFARRGFNAFSETLRDFCPAAPRRTRAVSDASLLPAAALKRIGEDCGVSIRPGGREEENLLFRDLCVWQFGHRFSVSGPAWKVAK